MFFVVISQVKDKMLLFGRLVLMLCILFLLVAQLYGALKSNGMNKPEHKPSPGASLQLE